MFSLSELFSTEDISQKRNDISKLNIDGLISEEAFRTLLEVERKRTERSGKPFMLMLLDISFIMKSFNKGTHDKNEMSSNLKKLAQSLATVTRDTDIKGWHESKHSLGIIFTEITKEGKDIIIQKIKECIESKLQPEISSNINISCFWYPFESEDEKKDYGYYEIFYPDPALKSAKNKIDSFAKRSLDIAGSLFGLFIFFPVFLFASVLIKLTSKGPVFFRQERVGKGGKHFRIYKFRTMRAINNDTKQHQEFMKQFIHGQADGMTDGAGNKVFKMTNDSRITKIGNFLRKTSLDEVPQFINVLIGDMSLVGPRPPIPYEVAEYDLWHRRRVLEVKPGITGYWQVEGRSKTNFDNMVRMDIRYIASQSFLFDLKVIVKTPIVLLTAKGAY